MRRDERGNFFSDKRYSDERFSILGAVLGFIWHSQLTGYNNIGGRVKRWAIIVSLAHAETWFNGHMLNGSKDLKDELKWQGIQSRPHVCILGWEFMANQGYDN